MKITADGFIEVDVTPEMLEEADRRNKEFLRRYGHAGTHRKNKEEQRRTGYVAESAVRSVFPDLEYADDPKVDFVRGETTFDSKAQGCNGPPAPNYSATLYEEQAARAVDYLVFSRVKKDFKKVWICGFISKADYLKVAKLQPAGTKNNNFTYDEARYETEYRKLRQVTSVGDLFESNGG